VVECDLAKVEVAGSNPVSRSTSPPSRKRGFRLLCAARRFNQGAVPKW
jgi:hypothetical protein